MAKNILVVDDSRALRQSVSFILTSDGYQVTEAADGAEGLAALDTGSFDMVVTDLNMPNMDGIEMIKRIRSGTGPHQFVPILMLTTESQNNKMEEGKAAGATGWIVKPFDTDKLLAVIKKLVG